MTDGEKVHLESRYPEETITTLKKMGHAIKPSHGGFGGYQAIMYDHKNKVYIAASESRKDGCAMGY